MSVQTPYQGIDHREYSNGLRVVVVEQHAQPLVAVSLRFGVGSRHERPGQIGFAQLLQHVMFSGTARTPRGTHLRTVYDIGGSAGATTSTDWTDYHHFVPAEALPLVLWLESDRLVGVAEALDQSALDSAREMLTHERHSHVDGRPYGDAMWRVAATFFPYGHPYHYPPTGPMVDVAAASVEDVRDFFATWYSPDRAVLSVVGDVRPTDVFAQVDEVFGWIPAGRADRLADPPTPAPIVGSVRVDVRTEHASRLVVGLPLPPRGSADDELHQLIAILLGTGPDSRLMRRLGRDRELLAQVRIGRMDQMSGASLCVVEMVPREGRHIDDVEKAYVEHMAEMAEVGVSEEEFHRALGTYSARRLEHWDLIANQADELSLAELAGRRPMSIESVRRVSAARLRGALHHWCGLYGQVTLRYLSALTA